MDSLTPYKQIALVVAAVAGAVSFSTRRVHSDSWVMWLGLLIPYLLLGAWAAVRLRQSQSTLRLKPKSGDITIGILAGLATALGGYVVLQWLAGAGTGREAWLYQVYAQVGPLQQTPLKVAALVLIVALEELVWRGHVQELLLEKRGLRQAVPLTALLYALAHLPTLFTLSDPHAGPNPLLFLGALGGGLIWGFLTLALRRLLPTILSHVVFSYFLSAPLPQL